jgi:hypothetical protein
MKRFELTGTGIGDSQDESALLQAAKDCGLKNPRLAYHLGLSNQPKTIRFSAPDWETANRLADQVRTIFYPENAEGRLCPMIRAYPVEAL